VAAPYPSHHAGWDRAFPISDPCHPYVSPPVVGRAVECSQK
jgi:hypothetical protein